MEPACILIDACRDVFRFRIDTATCDLEIGVDLMSVAMVKSVVV